MNLDDIQDRLKSEWQQTVARLEENSSYNALKDRFQSLTPLVQKLITLGVAALILLMILATPLGQYENSNISLAEFDTTRSLIKDLLRVQKEIQETPDIAIPPSIDSVRSRIESDLQGAQLLPEQMKGVRILPAYKSDLVGQLQNEGLVEVALDQLNLKQLTDLGAQFQNMSPSVKLKDLVINASRVDPRYFDAIYRLLVLKVEKEELPASEPPTPNKKVKK